MVKLVLWLFLAGICFLSAAIFRGVSLYRMAQSPAEYVLTGDLRSGSYQDKLAEINSIKAVGAVSLYRSFPVIIHYQGIELSFTCAELSGEYLKQVYGIEKSGAMQTFYMNQSAYKQLWQSLLLNGYAQPDTGNESIRITYSLADSGQGTMVWTDEGRNSAQDVKASYVQAAKSAELIILDDCLAEENPVLFCQGQNPDFSKHASGLCVYARHQGLEGSVIREIQKSGFALEDAQTLDEALYGQNIQRIRMKYELLLAGICLLCAAALWRQQRRKGNVA